MCKHNESELETLRELAKAVLELRESLPALENYRRDKSGKISYNPHTLSAFRGVWKSLNEWSKFKSEKH
jgi:hypothetical protein